MKPALPLAPTSQDLVPLAALSTFSSRLCPTYCAFGAPCTVWGSRRCWEQVRLENRRRKRQWGPCSSKDEDVWGRSLAQCAPSHAILLASSALDFSAACSPSSIGPSLSFSCPPVCYPKHWDAPHRGGTSLQVLLAGVTSPISPPWAQRSAGTGKRSGGAWPLLGWQSPIYSVAQGLGDTASMPRGQPCRSGVRWWKRELTGPSQIPCD